MKRPIRRGPTRHLVATVLFLAGGCASKASIPANDSDVDIQASTTATSDVKYIEIIVHQLSDGSLVYNSGLQPSSDFQDTRQHLEEVVALTGATDFLFDAKAFDVDKNLLKNGNQVQEATQPAGVSTTVLIVIDLNSGDTGVTSPADITAVTDNIPVLEPPTLTQSGGAMVLNYNATDLDQSADGGPIDSQETLTYFTSVLAGNVDISANLVPGLFTEGQTFTFSFNDTQPVKILSAVVDRLNQLTFAITDIDPVTGAFQTVEYGEGYALFDGNTLTPSPKKVHARNADDPTGPPSGPIAVVVLKHGSPSTGGITTSAPANFSVEAISRSDDSLVVTPNNVAYWNSGVVASFNRYEEQPDANGNIVIDFKLRVLIGAPTGTSFVNSPPPSLIDDTIKFAADGNNHFVFTQEGAEQATLPIPLIGSVTGGTSPGAAAELDGSWFDGSYNMPNSNDTNPGLDERQIYLQDVNDPTNYVFPVSVALVSGGSGSEVTFQIPTSATSGTYTAVLCTYGRDCTTAPTPITITASKAEACIPTAETIAANGFVNAFDIASDAAGNFYVADFTTGITKLDGALNPQWNNSAVPAGGIAVNPADGFVYAVEGDTTIDVLDPNSGELVATEEAANSIGVAFTPQRLVFDSAGAMYFVDGNNSVVVKAEFDGDDTWIADWETGVGDDPYGLTLAPDIDRIYVGNHESSSVCWSVQLSTGNYLGSFLVDIDPMGLAYDAAAHRLYVADGNGTYTNSILAFDAPGLETGDTAPVGQVFPPGGAASTTRSACASTFPPAGSRSSTSPRLTCSPARNNPPPTIPDGSP